MTGGRRSHRSGWRATLGATALVGLLAGCGSHHKAVLAPPTSAASPATSTAVAPTTTTRRAVPVCPLTGLPAPGGRVPARPALAIKVENLPAARPQYGLSAADMVVEEPVEGGITRFIVIYQCHDAARVEPVRSGRIIDPVIVEQFGAHPLFAYAGGIGAAVAAIDSSPLVDVGINRAPLSDYWRDPDRYAPHNLVTSTAVLYAQGVRVHAPAVAPPVVFPFGALPAGATPVVSVRIAYPSSDLVWTWSPGQRLWVRSYVGSGPAVRGEGGYITAANVVVMKVVMYESPWVEDATGAHENVLTLTGSGPAQVYRDGKLVAGSWVRPSRAATTRFVGPGGHPITLSPGPTWIELVPTTVAVTVNP